MEWPGKWIKVNWSIDFLSCFPFFLVRWYGNFQCVGRSVQKRRDSCIIISELRAFVEFGGSQGLVVAWNCQWCTYNWKKKKKGKETRKNKKKNNLDEEMYPRVLHAPVTLCLWLRACSQSVSMLKTVIFIFFSSWDHAVASDLVEQHGKLWTIFIRFIF